MGDAGFPKNPTDAAKAQGLIKTDHRELSVKINLARAQPPRRFDGPLQEPLTDASASIAFQNRHAPDLRAPLAHYDPRGSHRFSPIKSQKVNCPLVVAVHFNLCRHALLFYEHTHANPKSFF